MRLLPREGQNLLHSRFSFMLVPLLMFSRDSDKRQSQILTPIWTDKQSDDVGRSPFSIRNVANGKSVQKNVV